MANFSREQMIFILEKRLAIVEATLGIIPAGDAVINPRLGIEAAAKQQQKVEVKNDR